MKNLLTVLFIMISIIGFSQNPRISTSVTRTVLSNKDTLVVTTTTSVYKDSVIRKYMPPVGCNAKAPVNYILGPTKPGEIYITNATSRGWKGGDTIRIVAGTYSVIEIDSFGGDKCRNVVIINDGGLVNVTGSIRLQKDVHYVKILGTGVVGLTYGFRCQSFGFNRANHFTMENIEVGPNLPNPATNYKGGVGIYGKQDPHLNEPWTQYPNYTSRKITINNCYVHDVAGEGMYIGHTYPGADPYNSNIIPQRMDSVTISNNLVINCGWDGIQLSNARNGCLIYGNTVINFGIADIDGQRAGIISGGNTNANVYNNTVTNGTGNGLQVFGYGVMNFYGNTIANVGNTKKNIKGEESFYGIAGINTVEINPIQSLVIHDNQFNYPKEWGAIRVYDNGNSSPVNLYNNKFCFTVKPPDNWKTLYLLLKSGYRDVNNILLCK